MLDSYFASMILSILILAPIVWQVVRHYSSVAGIGLFLLLPLFISPFVVALSFNDMHQGIVPLSHAVNLPPSSELPLGSDFFGRDVWYTAWVSLANTFIITGLAILVTVALGLLVGLTMASRNEFLSWIFTWIIEFLEAHPFVFFLFISMAAFRQYMLSGQFYNAEGMRVLFFGVMLGIIAMPYLGRVVSLLARQELSSPYIETLRGAGVSWWRILAYNVLLSNILRPIAIQISLLIGIIVLMNSAVDYILVMSFGDLGRTEVLTLGELLAQSRKAIIYEQGYNAIITSIICVLASILGSVLLVEGLKKQQQKCN